VEAETKEVKGINNRKIKMEKKVMVKTWGRGRGERKHTNKLGIAQQFQHFPSVNVCRFSIHEC